MPGRGGYIKNKRRCVIQQGCFRRDAERIQILWVWFAQLAQFVLVRDETGRM